MSDCDDWSIKQVVYEYFDEAWGKHTWDRFASSYNNKCEVFNSKYDCAKTSGIDAFAQVWSNSVNWAVPPPRLIKKWLEKLNRKNVNVLFHTRMEICPVLAYVGQGG